MNQGIARVQANIRRVFDSARKEKAEAAVYAVLSQGAAMADTMTPIATSTLVNSRYQPQITVLPDRVYGHVGYTAQYAAAVHEAPGTLKGSGKLRDGKRPSLGQFWDPNAEPKFLTKGFEEIEGRIPDILRSAYRV